MKKNVIKTAVLITALGMVAVGCQKEQVIDPCVVSQDVFSAHNVMYSVDGVVQTETFYGEEEWKCFLDRMFALAEEGHKVSFRRNISENNVVSTKEKVVYTTTDKKEAEQWADAMESQGYSVSIEFNQNTGVYTCIAIR